MPVWSSHPDETLRINRASEANEMIPWKALAGSIADPLQGKDNDSVGLLGFSVAARGFLELSVARGDSPGGCDGCVLHPGRGSRAALGHVAQISPEENRRARGFGRRRHD